MSEITPLLTVTDLSLSFRSAAGPVSVLRNISIDVLPGEIVGVVGESGSGKSLTALQIARLLPDDQVIIDSGSIQFAGHDILLASSREMNDLRGQVIGFVFQEPMSALSPTLTIGKHLALVFKRHLHCSRNEAHRRAVEALDEVQIHNPEIVADQYPFELSGGMLQRVVIALAMSCHPALLIADEPTTALDVTVQAEILTLIRNLAIEHRTSVLFISHDLAVVSELCQRVFVFYGGEMIEHGSTSQILHLPQHPYTKALLGALPQVAGDKELHPIPGEPPDPRDRPTGCVFLDRCPVSFARCVTKPSHFLVENGHTAACWLSEPGAGGLPDA
jgi:oligopeptide/dipeptide ABC transporter ATP-binding protein